MIIMCETCPGRGWRRLHVAYIICEITGRLTVPTSQQTFWQRVV